MTVSVPSPFEAKASWVPGSNRHASTPWPIGTVVTSAPLVASEIAMSLLRQPLNRDRKSTRLNSSHRCISYAVFCLKKKKLAKTGTDLEECERTLARCKVLLLYVLE